MWEQDEQMHADMSLTYAQTGGEGGKQENVRPYMSVLAKTQIHRQQDSKTQIHGPVTREGEWARSG